MKKNLIIGLVLLVVGIVIFIAAFAFTKFNFKALSSEKYITNTYYVENAFSDIEIDIDEFKVTLIPYDGDECKVVSTETEKVKINVQTENGKLKITQEDNRNWTEHVGVFLVEKTVDVYLPEKEYGTLRINNTSGSSVISDGLVFSDINIKSTSGSVKCCADADILSIDNTSGSIKLEGVFAIDINIKATSGSVSLKSVNAENSITINGTSGSIHFDSVRCEYFDVSNVSGSVTLTDTFSKKSMKIKVSSGSVRLDDSDAPDIDIRTSSGSVKGTLLSDKIFVTETSSGSVDVPASFEGGKCYIKTSSGSIKIKIAASN